MIKFKNGSVEVKILDSTIVVLSNKRNVFNLLNGEDIETLQKLEKNIKECNKIFKFKMSFNSRKDILKIIVNGIVYLLNAILV